jgi:transcriptional regulator with PAS, ATPase and Fis domain
MTTLRPCATPPAGLSLHPDPFPAVHGRCPAMRALKQHMARVAEDGEVTVLILGESGTGKERIAKAIHDRSPRAGAPYVVVNCAGLSPTLIEDELFGHVRGAFTGAVHDRAGPFERAAGGTVLLDEVGDLALDLQMKLLRALQQRTVQRLGGRQDVAFDVRVIAATNVDLAAARERGRLREDLYFRLKVYELHVPPLRHRGAGDLVELTRVIVRSLAERRQRTPPAIDPRVLECFAAHRWPGNIRELENTLERMLVASGGAGVLTVEHLPEDLTSRTAVFPRAVTVEGSSAATASDEQVAAALAANGFSRRRAAAALGLSRHQLYRRERRSPSLARILAVRDEPGPEG